MNMLKYKHCARDRHCDVIGTIPDKLPFELDMERQVEEPFDFQEWINTNRETIDEKGRLAVFDCDKYQFRV